MTRAKARGQSVIYKSIVKTAQSAAKRGRKTVCFVPETVMHIRGASDDHKDSVDKAMASIQ